MTVQNEIPSNSFTATGDLEFQLDYYVHEIEELLVTLDGAIVNPNLYTIQFGTLQDYNGAKVIFEVPITGTLVIARNTPLSRSTSYSNAMGNITGSNLNNDFDRLYRITQEQALSTDTVNVRVSSLNQEQTASTEAVDVKVEKEIQDRYNADMDIRGYVAGLALGIDPVDIKLPLLTDVDIGVDSKGKFLTEIDAVAPNRAFAFVDLVKANISELSNVDNTADIDKPISTLVQAEIDSLIAEDVALNTAINALANGTAKAYLTFSELDANKLTLATNSFAQVTNDSNPANNGIYQWNGTVLTKSTYDPLNQAKSYVDANRLFKPFVLAAATNFNTLIVEGRTVVPTNEIAAACTNRPSSNAGVLDVALIGSGVLQVYRVFEFDLAYERQKLSNGTWTTWVQLASKDMVDTSAANSLQSAKDYADANRLFKPAIITSGQYTNIDQITVSGHYVLALNGIASEITGLPESKTGFISVLKNDTMVSQVYRPSDADYYYTRTSSSAGVFGSFAKIFGQAYVDNNPLFKPINLTTAVDLNTITTPYLATVTNPTNITLALNFPVAEAIGTLEVLQAGFSATVFQKYTLVDSTVYVRAFPNGTWSAWTSQSAINKSAAEVNRNKIFSLEDFDVKGFVQSTNLFDGAELNKSVDLSGNIITEAGRWLSDYYPIKTGDVFKIPSSSYRVAYYDENKNFLIRTGTADTVNPSVGVARGYFRLSGTNNLATMQLNKGATLLPYEPHYIDLKSPKPKTKPLILPTETVMFTESKNLFDKSDVLLNKSVDLSGNIIDDIRWLGGYIPCVSSEIFTAPNDSFRIAYYDVSKNFIVRSGAGGSTSFTTPNAAEVAYMRFSGLYDLDLMQVTKGATTLPYQPFGEIKLKNEYLPISIDIDTTALKAEILSEISVSNYEPSVPTLALTKIEETWQQPLWLSSDGTTMYGSVGAQLLQSTNDWVTRQNIGAVLPKGILAVRVAGDGQLLVATLRDEASSVVAKVYKTVGYTKANPSVTTFTEVLTINSTQANITNSWGFSVYNNIVTVSEYGLRGLNGAKNVYLSEDNGDTFNLIFNQYTQVVTGRPELTMSAHMHTAAYDPYYNRIWVVVGDNPNTATYYSDDLGVTWVFVTGSTGTGAIQYTGIQALPDCVIFGSDRSPNGIYVYRRNGKNNMPVIKPLLIINSSTELTHVFGLPFKRDWSPTAPTYFAADRTDGTQFKPMITATVDGKKGHIMGELGAGEALHGIFGATASGKIIVVSQTSTSAGVIISTANAPTWTKV